MRINGAQLSLLGRAALATTAGGTRVSLRGQPEPVDPTEAIKDPTSREYRELQDLAQRDRAVRQHEQAHVAAGGQYVRGGAALEFETGPDGKRYAVGGEVQIDVSAVAGDPEATLRKMAVVQRAATAPADPSAQDRAVASQAAARAVEARREMREMDSEETQGGDAAQDSAPIASRHARDAYQGPAAGAVIGAGLQLDMVG